MTLYFKFAKCRSIIQFSSCTNLSPALPTDAKAVANTYKSKYTETSAALNHNVDELLVGILTQIRLKLQTQVKVCSNLQSILTLFALKRIHFRSLVRVIFLT